MAAEKVGVVEVALGGLRASLARAEGERDALRYALRERETEWQREKEIERERERERARERVCVCERESGQEQQLAPLVVLRPCIV